MPEDPFELLGLAARFDLERDEIERRYRSRVTSLHPDSGRADQDAAGRAAALNDARAELLNPERRAGLVLARLGGPSPEADRTLPAGFLGEIMEVREAMGEAKASRDPAALERWRVWAGERRHAFIRSVSAALGPRSAPASPEELREVRRTLNAWRYVERMIEQLEE